MARVIDLIPGDLVRLAGREACYVSQTAHPLYPALQLVIWRLPDGEWSHDALRPTQDVGDIIPFDSSEARAHRLRKVLHGGGQWWAP